MMTSSELCTYEFKCAIPEEMKIHDIGNFLPHWNTTIWEIKSNENETDFAIRIFIAAKTIEEFTLWRKEYEKINSVNYSIVKSGKGTGRYLEYKQLLYCHHNTRCKRTYEDKDPHSKLKTTKNTNCPSSITCKIHSIKKSYRGQNKEMGQILASNPCEIVIKPSHNHKIDGEASLKFRKMPDELKNKLIDLYNQGYSPKSALEFIKMEIRLNYDDYDVILKDRSKCPDYDACRYLHQKEFKNLQFFEFNEHGKELVVSLLKMYNDEVQEICGEMEGDGPNHVICICTPLMKRAHKTMAECSEIVLIDSSVMSDKNGRVFTLLTSSQCGGVPLGVIITSSEKTNLIVQGFELLKKIVGDSIFYGNKQGPKIMLTDDSQKIKNAVEVSWPNTTNSLCNFHVLQTLQKWLNKTPHGIPRHLQSTILRQFRAIMFAKNVTQSVEKFHEADNFANTYPDYKEFLQSYWKRNEIWTLGHRNILTNSENSSYCEGLMKFWKDKIFGKLKFSNVLQLVDFILSKFTLYYQKRLLELANNGNIQNNFGAEMSFPESDVLEQSYILNDQLVIVPSDDEENTQHVVDMAALTCTCSSSTSLCNHTDWATLVINSENYIENESLRRILHVIATGDLSDDSLLPACNQQELDHNYVASNTIDVCIAKDEGEEIENNNEEVVEEANELLAQLTEMCKGFISISPEHAVRGLRSMCENLSGIENVSDFELACLKFGPGCSCNNVGHPIIPEEPFEESSSSKKRKVCSST